MSTIVLSPDNSHTSQSRAVHLIGGNKFIRHVILVAWFMCYKLWNYCYIIVIYRYKYLINCGLCSVFSSVPFTQSSARCTSYQQTLLQTPKTSAWYNSAISDRLGRYRDTKDRYMLMNKWTFVHNKLFWMLRCVCFMCYLKKTRQFAIMCEFIWYQMYT